MQEAQQTIGKIRKVAGPLVVAVDAPQAKMYEVVKVGKEKLIGEVIRIEGEEVFIQVYEETAGVGPGEPVYLTGSPLTVELGPGLVSGIYDGIQRPLTALQEKSGEFIARGIEARALDSEKKWPVKVLKKQGDEVVAGDIIAEVQETKLLKHKIMAPPFIEKGTIASIVSDGEYTIDEVIAEIKTEGGKPVEVKMAHKWPIRQPRPAKDKLVPSRGLVTGQRVIDTLFPIAKGGAGCVPGPFGSGKCVSSDTLVLLGTGKLTSIKELFEEFKDKGEKTVNKKEEYTVLSSPIEVLSHKDGKITKQKVKAVYKGKSDYMVEIETKTGRKLKVTPIHKLFTLGNDFTLEEKQAGSFKKGQYIAMPRVLPVSEKEIKFNPYEIFGRFRVVDKWLLQKIQKDIAGLGERAGSLKSVADELAMSYAVLVEYKSGRNKPTLDFVKKLYNFKGERLPRVSIIKGERESRPVKIPTKLTKDVAEFLGLMFSEGSFKKNTVHFYNNCQETQERFKQLCEKIFGITPKRGIANSVECSTVLSVVVATFLRYAGFPEYQKSLKIALPEFLLAASKEKIGKFLGAYFIGDGYVGKGSSSVEISTSSPNLSSGLAYLLQRLGILYSLKEKKTKVSTCYRVTIYGYDNVKRFYEVTKLPYPKFNQLKDLLCGLSSNLGSRYDVVPISPYLLKKVLGAKEGFYSKLKRRGIEAHNYISRGERLTSKMFRRIVEVLSLKEMEKFAFNHLSHIFFDEIKSIRLIKRVTEVYDLEVEETHNFIGGNAPCFFHNTVIQHQYAKWSDADIIIFVGCGERGNEMCDLLTEFPELKDPKTGRPLMERTVLIANTSNMPVAAREASVYTGITIGEYFRDMGYSVALLADSTSRWAEALREISGRLEEMPGDEGYPAYLGSRTAAFYERAGYVKCQGSEDREGFLTVVGAVSPPGGDLSEPVTQNTLRVTKVFWALDAQLAYKRHFPAINWLTSYTLYNENLKEFLDAEGGDGFNDLKRQAMEVLQKEAELEEIVRLVGVEALSQQDQFLLEVARIIREDFLHQNAFVEIDTYTSLKKQYLMLKTIMQVYEKGKGLIEQGRQAKDILGEALKDKLAKMKFVSEDKPEQFNLIDL